MASDETFREIDLHRPKWNQENYFGRAKHFFTVTNPLNILLSNNDLDAAKEIVLKQRAGQELPEGTTLDDLWRAKYRYDSAFHPDTNQKMMLIGRMSAQVPMNMTVTGCMMTFYRTPQAVIFWQWINQTFNALVNYTNRSGDAPISPTRIGASYVCATTGAVTTALFLNSLTKKLPTLIGRFVPFAAVAAANCINIPMMRSSELTNGVPVSDHDGNRLCESKAAAKKAIKEVTYSRIGMAIPGMTIPAILMNRMAKGKFLTKFPFMNAPVQVGMVGACLVFATPLCCALFPQKSSILVSHLEEEAREVVLKKNPDLERVYFNKGL